MNAPSTLRLPSPTRAFAWLVVVLVLLAQPCFALRLSCAAVGRLFPERCCCASPVRSCCAARAAAEHPERDQARAPRACSCELELPAGPAAERPSTKTDGDLGAERLDAGGTPHALAANAVADLVALRLARLFELLPERPPGNSAPPAAPPRGSAALERGLAAHLAFLSVLLR